MTYSILKLLIAIVPALALKTITVKNECKGTIWPAMKGTGATKIDGTPQPHGWKQAAGQSVSFKVPETWGPENRVWGRTGCAENGANCKIGACATNGLLCSGNENGQNGATLAEFNIDAGATWYDVSIVDGFNLPIEITSTAGCPTGSCGVGAGHDILTMCDSRLVYPPGSSVVWSCASACNVGQALSPSFDWNNSQWCCRSNGGPMQEACLKEQQPWYKQYKPHCQKAYVYPADDNPTNPAPLFRCDKGDYTITFCPGGEGSGTSSTSEGVTLDPGVSLHTKRRLGNI